MENEWTTRALDARRELLAALLADKTVAAELEVYLGYYGYVEPADVLRELHRVGALIARREKRRQAGKRGAKTAASNKLVRRTLLAKGRR